MPPAIKRAGLLLLAASLLLPGLAGAYEVTRSYNGAYLKWDGNSCTFVVNTNGMPSGALEAIQAAMRTWSEAGANFSFIYGGSSDSSDHGVKDGTNLIDQGQLDSKDTIAINYFWYHPRMGYLLDSDIRFNSDYNWSTSGDSNSMDLQNIATHEMGHSLSLEDLYGRRDQEKTMYGYADQGETKKRTLDDDDISGIKAIYP